MKNSTAKKCVSYCRVSFSTQETEGYSLPSQEKLSREYAEKKEFKILKVFKITESASGKQIRKTFNEMLKYVDRHKINIILCEKIDRLTRNPKDAVTISDWLEIDEKREIHFVKDNFIVNKNTTAHECLVWDMKVAIARFYTKNLSEEVKKGQKEKIAQGWLPTKPPHGYKTIGEKGHKIHVIDEKMAPFIRKMFELYSSGNYSLSKLNAVMHKEGLRNRAGNKLCISIMHSLLADPFYYGKILWKGELYDGKQEPIISKELFDEVQNKMLRKTTNPQYKKHLYTFKAFVRCGECGGTITWEKQKGKIYGHCNHYKPCKQNKCVREDEVEKQLFPLFEGVAPQNNRVLKWLEGALKESHADEKEYNNTKRENLNKIIAQMDKRLERIYDDKLDGKITADFYERKFNEYKNEKENALNELAKLSESRNLYYEAGFAIHELACNARRIYQSEKATTEERRLLLSYIFSNYSLKDQKISPNYTLAFEFLAEWMPIINKAFELQKNRLHKGKTGDLSPVCPKLLPKKNFSELSRSFCRI